MQLTIQAFAAARDLLGPKVQIELPDTATTADLRIALLQQYPVLSQLRDFAIARNEAYALPDECLQAGDEIVIIPPVAGG